MFDMSKVTEYVCDRYYHVTYDKSELNGREMHVEGLLLNYASGNIVLLTQMGICHIRYKDIIFMIPIDPPMNRLSKEFKELLESFKEDDKPTIEVAMHDWFEAYLKGAGDFMKYLMAYAHSGKSLYESEMEDILVEFAKQFGEVNEISE